MSDSLIHAVAGSAGGVVAMSLTYPLIFLSTRAAVETKKNHTSTLDALARILRSEGISGIYSGLTSSLLGIALTNGVYYYYYELTKGAIIGRRAGKGKALSTLESMLAGLIAGSATTLISNPIWVIQTTQAVQTVPSAPAGANTAAGGKPKPKPKEGIMATARKIMDKDGLLAFWRGVGPALVLVVNPILQYTVFEQLKNLIVGRRQEALRARGSAQAVRLTDWDFFCLGAVSKLVATSLTYPYIVLKSRQQSGHSSSPRSSLHALHHILTSEGLQGLYRGISSKLLQSVLTAAILFVGQRRIYEVTKAAIAALAARRVKSK
ncbi:mitochondrial carrier [Calocera cornea HHB12733]|uniref:Mitochondrial carrier n=1 Tax=Calocera cornea HHB12733 TaxID=1353952 RepID=A0A165DD06_9BASI|nr:mitochondrial carrier [Calocera cornea HHB12733]